MKTKLAIFLALATAILVGLFLLFRPTPSSRPVLGPMRVYDLRVEDGRLITGPEVIQVPQGQEVTLSIVSDRTDVFHLRGYDLHAVLPAGVPKTLRFKAERSGRFDLELDRAHAVLGALEVEPR
ncbi:MAG: hypothetical protein ACREQ9_12705 [Candidatus Binatia bacterium]